MSTLGLYHGSTLLNENNVTETKMQNKIKLEYYSIEKKIYEQAKETTIYGILILKKEYDKDNIKVEKHSVEKVSTNQSNVMNIIKLLKSYKVTPIALEDVLEDLLKKKEYQTA